MNTYLFVVWDSNDEALMKVIKRHREAAADIKGANVIAENLLGRVKPAESERPWVEIFELVGGRSK
jgi:hypothetical protein